MIPRPIETGGELIGRLPVTCNISDPTGYSKSKVEGEDAGEVKAELTMPIEAPSMEVGKVI